MRGAAFLSGVQDAIVIDIGGTTSDVGVLKGGFPRQSSTRVKVCCQYLTTQSKKKQKQKMRQLID